MKILVTGGAGFIGSAVIRHVIGDTGNSVVNLDKLTYAGNLDSLEEISGSNRYAFERVDIADQAEVERVFREQKPDSVMHLAAESHVDRSIDRPADFVWTNVLGTCVLLEVAERYWGELTGSARDEFRFHHVSTDEVYGDLDDGEDVAAESAAYAPNSPYAASKASADHLVRAWSRTYGLPTLITNSTNNYGPYQFPEKLIPLTILNALEGKVLPVFGDGDQVRDWLYVEDHAEALVEVLTRGRVGETYNIGGDNQVRNIDVVESICALLEELAPEGSRQAAGFRALISHVEDRPGHDRRYGLDIRKVGGELDWRPTKSFQDGLRETVQWYLANLEWCRRVQTGTYRRERLGLRGKGAA